MTCKPSEKRVVAIIQARQNSKRLHEKCFLHLAGIPLLAHVILRAQAIKGVSEVIVATGNKQENQGIIALATQYGATPFCGSEENVLKRYYTSAQQYSADYIIRITGDNPFTDVDYASMAVGYAISNNADLASISGIPLGTAVELIKYEALELAYLNAEKPHQKEHVTPYIKENVQSFTIMRKKETVYNSQENLRLTIDTEKDFKLASTLYSALHVKGEIFSLHNILNYLRLYPEIGAINRDVQQRPMTHFEDATHTTHNLV